MPLDAAHRRWDDRLLAWALVLCMGGILVILALEALLS